MGIGSEPARNVPERNEVNMTPDSILCSRELAERLQVPERTLDQWAYTHKGPRYARVGRYRRYRWADVEAWLDANTVGGAA